MILRDPSFSEFPYDYKLSSYTSQQANNESLGKIYANHRKIISSITLSSVECVELT